MSKKHYIAIAEILSQELSKAKNEREKDIIFNIMTKLEDIFKADNDKFSPVTFREAVKAHIANV